jgi:CPA1 family monovalent cation:H+ antiporter
MPPLHLALLLLGIAAAVSVAAEAMRVPYTVALVITGLAAGHLRAFPAVHLTPEALLTLLILPLLFEGGLRLPPQWLRACGPLIVLLAIPGTLFAALAIAAAAAAAVHLQIRTALLLGAIASAIDPAGVLALIREEPVPPRLGTVLAAEAVLNDGVAIVLFTVARGAGTPGPAALLLQFLWLIGAGAVVGATVAVLLSSALGRTEQPLVEALGSLIVALAAFVAAERAGASGVIAVVAAGVIFRSYGLRYVSEAGRETLLTLWDFIAFLANSVLFLLIGIEVPVALLARHGTLIGVVVLAALAARAASVYGVAPLASVACALPRAWRHLLAWSGLRGGVAIALVLGVGADVPGHEAIAAATFGLVLFTLLVQGLTVRPVMRRLGLLPPPGPRPA